MENSLNSTFITNASEVHRNLTSEKLYNTAIENNEGELSKHGALVVKTGKKTGRSANDKFFVRDKKHGANIHFGETNVEISSKNFDKILDSFIEYSKNKKIYIHDLFGGADRKNSLPVTVITEFAWHGLFARHLLVRPTEIELKHYKSEFTIINFPLLKEEQNPHGTNSDTANVINLEKKII